MAVYPYGPQDGVVYTLTGADGSEAVFNDPDDANYVGMARFSGLDDAEVRESIEDRASAHGAIQGLNWRGRRPITANIEIVPTSTVDRNEKWSLLRRAMNSLHDDGTLSWTPDGGLPVQIGVRKNGPVRRSDDAVGMVTAAQISLQAADPNIVSQTLHTDSGTTAVETITNQGDAEAAPTITVTGPASASVAILNTTQGSQLTIPLFTPSTYLADAVSGGWSTSIAASGSGVFVDTSDNVYVAGGDGADAHTVRKYNSAGTLQWSSGSFGTGNGQFNTPMGVAVDGSGVVYVADTFNNRVQKLTSGGAYSAQQSTSAWPTQITVNSGGTLIYVAGGGFNTYEIKSFNSSLTLQATFGTLGTTYGAANFQAISGMCVHSSGDLIVADRQLHCIKRLSSAGVWENTFGQLGAGTSQFNRPAALTIDTSDKLYVLDEGNTRVQRFATWTAASPTAPAFEAQMGEALGTNMGMARDLATATVVFFLHDGALQKYQAATSRVAALDFEKRTITVSGNNAYDIVDPITSDWWTLDPGDNSIQVIGATSWTIEWRDAWL